MIGFFQFSLCLGHSWLLYIEFNLCRLVEYASFIKRTNIVTN